MSFVTPDVEDDFMADSDIPAITLPLTPYDILGYLAPGGTMILSVLIFEHFLNSVVGPQLGAPPTWHTPLASAMTALYATVVRNDSAVPIVLFAIGFAAVAYIAGHVIGSLSSLLLDRVLIFKGYGYPYSQLLQLPRDADRYDVFSRAFYRGVFLWLNVYFALRYVSLFLSTPLKQLAIPTSILNHVADWIGWFVILAIVFKLVAGSKWTTRWPRLDVVRLRATSVAAALLNGPYELLAQPLSKIMNTRNSFDKPFLTKYREHFRDAFDLDADLAGTNNYWMCYCYVLERCPELRTLITHWLRMYVFARNLATGFYIAFLYCFVWLLVEAPKLGATIKPSLGPVLFIPILLFVSSFLLLVRYYYLYVCYFTKFIFRAFVYAESPGAGIRPVPPAPISSVDLTGADQK